jgi:hypothetical protein
VIDRVQALAGVTWRQHRTLSLPLSDFDSHADSQADALQRYSTDGCGRNPRRIGTGRPPVNVSGRPDWDCKTPIMGSNPIVASKSQHRTARNHPRVVLLESSGAFTGASPSAGYSWLSYLRHLPISRS